MNRTTCAKCGAAVPDSAGEFDWWLVSGPEDDQRTVVWFCSQACLALWARETLVEATS